MDDRWTELLNSWQKQFDSTPLQGGHSNYWDQGHFLNGVPKCVVTRAFRLISSFGPGPVPDAYENGVHYWYIKQVSALVQRCMCTGWLDRETVLIKPQFVFAAGLIHGDYHWLLLVRASFAPAPGQPAVATPVATTIVVCSIFEHDSVNRQRPSRHVTTSACCCDPRSKISSARE